ncbi:TetR/AcrR family transcriptional regulator [Nocardia huaxiensis]|uniref:TetR/AcrR family transcriptional regulator n=1 Tax=Nocardia huaxiensis TaxID=2755382 RepID=A0A7D6VB74_9NOCA|nr:TetR/AcrR family transcriptional regulator [Nocardia huaxiensis]QLY31314.1 TetR/AcrR family transcriptional regulator [Nocardia huaxiensis]
MAASTPEPRRRADAERSRAAILDAAARLLPNKPDAGLAAIAAAAGVTRQTIYAHFTSREELLAAVVEQVTGRTVAAMDTADLDQGTATEALLRILDLGWRAFETHPAVQRFAPTDSEQSRELHNPVTDHLLRLLRRGQRDGEFTRTATPEWLAAALIAVGHAAGEEVTAGRMSQPKAEKALRETALRLVGNTQRPARNSMRAKPEE